MPKVLIFVAVGAIGIFSPALAQTPQAIHEIHLNAVDQNGDGSISQAEYRNFMLSAFTQLDANGNGRVSSGELGVTVTETEFAALDRNGDGQVTQQEFMTQVMADFAIADRGSDGQLR